MLLSNIKNENTINTFKSPNSIVNKLVSDTLNSIPEAIAICDKNGIILKINSKASRLFGWTDNELIEKKTFDILLTNRYRNNISSQLKTDPSSILDTTHFVYGLKKDGKTFPANILISNFSRDFLVKDRKTYLVVFSTSFIISQLKSNNEPVKTKFFDGDNYAHLKEKQSLELENHFLSNTNSELNQLSNKGRNENHINFEKNNRQLEKYETCSLIDSTQKEDMNILNKTETILHDNDFIKNKLSKEKDHDKNEGNNVFQSEKMMMYPEIEEEEEEDNYNQSLPKKYPSSSISSFKPSASIPIKKEKIEVIPTYIPSSIQNFSFYTSPLKHLQTLEESYEERRNRTTYSRYQNEFEEITKLGKGGFGSVYQVRNKLDGQFYAIKKIKLQCDPKNTMECVMNSDFFNAPLPQTCLPKNDLPLSSVQDEFNPANKANQINNNNVISNTNNYNINNINKNNNKNLDINTSLPTTSNTINTNIINTNNTNNIYNNINTNNNKNIPRLACHRRYLSATTSLSDATSKFPINTLSTKDIRIIQEVKTFARISNHPNIVRYHGAWIEALEITESGSDDEFSDSDLSSDEFDDENSIANNDSSSSSSEGDSVSDSDSESESDNDSMNNINNDESEMINEIICESDSDSDNDSSDSDEETEFTQDVTSDIDNSRMTFTKDDFEIVFEGNSNRDIHIDIDDSFTSQDELSDIQNNKKIKETKQYSKLSQEIQQPKLELNDKTFVRDDEESFIISFEDTNSNDEKSLSFIMNDSNSNTSIISEKKERKSNKFPNKIKSSKKNESLLKHALKKRNRDYLKLDSNKTLITQNTNNLTIPNIRNNLNNGMIKKFSLNDPINKFRSINSPTLSVIEENCNSSSYVSDNTSVLSNSYTKIIPSSLASTKDSESYLDVSKKEIIPIKRESILSSSLGESSRTKIMNKETKRVPSSSLSSTGMNDTESSFLFKETDKPNNFGTFVNASEKPSFISLNSSTNNYTIHDSYQNSQESGNLKSILNRNLQSPIPKTIQFKEPVFKSKRHHHHQQQPHHNNNGQKKITSPPNYINKQEEKGPSKKLCSVLLIQMEFVSGKTLQAWLEERNTSSNPMVDRKIVIKIFKQIVQGLAHIHWNGFIHCDIKPANIFLQEDHHILIGDFGLAKKIVTDSSYLEQDDDESMGAGTYLYASPEQLSEHRCYDNKTDIYSLGILLFEMLCPFSTGMERVKTLMDIRQGKFSDKFIKTWPREFLLIKSLLQPDPMERPTALEILDSEVLLNSYPLSDTTDLLVALDLHISPEQGYNKNNIELNHFSSNLNKKYNYQNNSNSPSISPFRSIKNNMNEGKNNINNNASINNKQGSMIPSTRCINQATSTAEINTVNASTYINSKCNKCQEKDLMISSYRIKYRNSEDAIKELKESLCKANRKIFIYNVLAVFVSFILIIIAHLYYSS